MEVSYQSARRIRHCAADSAVENGTSTFPYTRAWEIQTDALHTTESVYDLNHIKRAMLSMCAVPIFLMEKKGGEGSLRAE